MEKIALFTTERLKKNSENAHLVFMLILKNKKWCKCNDLIKHQVNISVHLSKYLIFKVLFRVCVHGVCVCVHVCVCVCSLLWCVHLDGLNADHKFRVWITILGHTSLHFISVKKKIRLNTFFFFK